MERIGGKRREETKREDKRRGEKKREEKSREEERIKSGNAVWLQSSCVAYAIYLCSLSQGFLLLLPKTASSIWLALKVSHHCSEMFPNGLEIQEFLIDIVFNSNETSRNRAKSAPPRLHPSQPRDVANIAILDKTEEIYIITPQSYDSEDYRHTDDEEWRVLSRIRQRWRQKGFLFLQLNDESWSLASASFKYHSRASYFAIGKLVAPDHRPKGPERLHTLERFRCLETIPSNARKIRKETVHCFPCILCDGAMSNG